MQIYLWNVDQAKLSLLIPYKESKSIEKLRKEYNNLLLTIWVFERTQSVLIKKRKVKIKIVFHILHILKNKYFTLFDL